MSSVMNAGRIAKGYWISTTLFVLQMGFTAYAQLCLPVATQVFPHLGLPEWFRIELTLMKLVGVVVLIVPWAPPRLKEWAYSGFAIVLGSALVAHLAVGDRPAQWLWSVGTFALGAASYFFHRKRDASAGGAIEPLVSSRGWTASARSESAGS